MILKLYAIDELLIEKELCAANLSDDDDKKCEEITSPSIKDLVDFIEKL